MEGELRPVEDFNDVFAAFTRSKDPVLLVGGHAVNVWALSYYDRATSEIVPHEPLTSSDMDVYATRNALLWLGRELGGEVRFAGPREIVLGAMEIEVSGQPFLLEALRSVKGVSDEELKGRASLDIAGNEILVPLPHVLLKAKLSNVLELDQEDRQDVKHVKLLAVVLREYLIDLARAATEENERESLRIVREAVKVANSVNSKKFEEDHGIRFGEYIPLENLENSTARLASFARNEYKKRFE